MKRIRINLRHMIMLAALVALIAAYFANLSGSHKRVFQPIAFSPQDSSLLVAEFFYEEENFQLSRSHSDYLVFDLLQGNTFRVSQARPVIDVEGHRARFADEHVVLFYFDENVDPQTNQSVAVRLFRPWAKWDTSNKSLAPIYETEPQGQYQHDRHAYASGYLRFVDLVDLSGGSLTELTLWVDAKTLVVARLKNGRVLRLSDDPDVTNRSHKYVVTDVSANKSQTLEFALEPDLVHSPNLQTFLFYGHDQGWLVNSDFEVVKQFKLSRTTTPAISGSGKMVAWMDQDESQMIVYDMASGEVVQKIETSYRTDVSPRINLLFSNNDELLAVASDDQIDIWSLKTGICEYRLGTGDRLWSYFFICTGLLLWPLVAGRFCWRPTADTGRISICFKLISLVFGLSLISYSIFWAIARKPDSIGYLLILPFTFFGGWIGVKSVLWLSRNRTSIKHAPTLLWLLAIVIFSGGLMVLTWLAFDDFHYLFTNDALLLQHQRQNEWWWLAAIVTGLGFSFWGSRNRVPNPPSD